MSLQPSIDNRGRGGSLVPGLLAVVAALVALDNGGAPLDGGSGTARALSVVLPPLAFGLAAGALCLPVRPAAALALVGAASAGLGRGLVYDPVRDRPCARCLPSPFATHPDAQFADITALLGGLLVLAALIIAVVRHRSVWTGIGAVIAGLSTTAYDTPHGVHIGAVRGLIVVAALSLATAVARLALARRAMMRLAEALTSGGSPDEVLKTHLRDAGAWVEFSAPSPVGPSRWVTGDGAPVSDRIPLDEEVITEHTTVVRSQRQSVARIHHTRPLAPIGPELILRLEQVGLEAGLASQVAEIAASRTRIVKRADAERRQLERDLHDGAQQYLLALAVDLSLAASESPSNGAVENRALGDSRRDAEAALDELRRIARGVYPVLLGSGGLLAALQELSRRVGTRITVDGPTAGDVASTAAAALYGLVEELASSKPAEVTLTVCGVMPQVVEIVGGTVGADSLHLERIAASGGNVEHMPGRIVVTFP